MTSTHKVEVVPVQLTPHPNADSLSIVNVFGGYPCCIRTEDWKNGDLAAYVPPDSLVDVSRPEFAFLANGSQPKHRIRSIKLRGVRSFGLLVPAPAGSQVGDDVADRLGVEHYEPEIPVDTRGEAESAPAYLRLLPRYDVESLRRHPDAFEPGERVLIYEKIHGANARYCWLDDRLWCGSRSEWKKQAAGTIWWRALETCPQIEAFCRRHPGHVLYGEVYGRVQSLHYGVPSGRIDFAAFDILGSEGRFWRWPFRHWLWEEPVPCVPLIAEIPYDFEAACAFAEGPSLIPGANHVREGCVIRPVSERSNTGIGRLILKVVGGDYLEKGW